MPTIVTHQLDAAMSSNFTQIFGLHSITWTDAVVTELVTRYVGVDVFGGTVLQEHAQCFDAKTGFFDPEAMGLDAGSYGVRIETREEGSAWTARERWVDETTGGTFYQATVRADGLNVQRVNFRIDSFVSVADTADTKAWSLRQTFHYEHNDVHSEIVIWDDGRVVATSFGASGAPFYREAIDPGNAHAWSWKSLHWDETGQLSNSSTMRDDGRLIVRSFTDGVKRTEVVKDTTDAFDWERIERTYDDSGALTDTIRVMDPEQLDWFDTPGLDTDVAPFIPDDSAAYLL